MFFIFIKKNTNLTKFGNKIIKIATSITSIYHDNWNTSFYTFSKRLCVLTANNIYNICEFFLNRPGRIFYKIDYHCLDEDVILGYLDDHLKDKKKKNKIAEIAKDSHISFDVLQSLVEEVNRYPLEKLSEIVSILNMSLLTGVHHHFKASWKNGSYQDVVKINPLIEPLHIESDFDEENEDDDSYLVDTFLNKEDCIVNKYGEWVFEKEVSGDTLRVEFYIPSKEENLKNKFLDDY